MDRLSVIFTSTKTSLGLGGTWWTPDMMGMRIVERNRQELKAALRVLTTFFSEKAGKKKLLRQERRLTTTRGKRAYR